MLAGRRTPVAKNAWVRVISTGIASRFAVFFSGYPGSGRAIRFLAGRGPGCLVLRNLGGHVGLVTGSVTLSESLSPPSGKISLLFGQLGTAKGLPYCCCRLDSGCAFLHRQLPSQAQANNLIGVFTTLGKLELKDLL